MNRAEQPAILVPIPDVQSGRDERRIAIDQVGIKGLRYPLPFMDRDRVVHTTIATCNVYVALPDDRKGTHMSRLVALLEERAAVGAPPLTVATLRDVIDDLLVRLNPSGWSSVTRQQLRRMADEGKGGASLGSLLPS